MRKQLSYYVYNRQVVETGNGFMKFASFLILPLSRMKYVAPKSHDLASDRKVA